MFSKIPAWTKEIIDTTNQYKSFFNELDERTLNIKPNPDTWSIGQVIQHVIQANESYYPLIEKYRTGTLKIPFLGRFKFIRTLFGKMVLMGVKPNRKMKSKTFPVWEPTQTNFDMNITQLFINHQVEFERFVVNNSDLFEKGAYIHSPANSKIIYDFETAIEILLSHEKRHLNQAREILDIIRR